MEKMKIKWNENILEGWKDDNIVIFDNKRIYEAWLESDNIWYAVDNFGREQSISRGEDIVAGSFFKNCLEVVS